MRQDAAGIATEIVTLPSLVSVPRQIVTGPDGNLWVTESAANKIGRLTLSGSLTEFNLPTIQAVPYGITVGPDKNLWVTEAGAGKVARVTTSGQVTEYQLKSPQSEPADITTGPDGNLWFAEKAANLIGRLTPSGVLTEYPVPTAAAQPLGVVWGPDGNLWFTELAVGKVGKLDPGTGAITEISLGNASAHPGHIVAGPDRRSVWFAEQGVDSLGEIDDQGNLYHFYIEAGAAPDNLVLGADGNMWATLAGKGAIGRLSFDPPAFPSTFSALPAFRLLDTRDGTGGVPVGPIQAGGVLIETLSGGVALPASGLSSLVLNVTVANTTAAGYLTVYPGGTARPLASNLNFTAGMAVSNLVQVIVSAGGQVCFFNSAGSTDVIVDVAGYMSVGLGPAGLYNPLVPARVLDTRSGIGADAVPIAEGSPIALQVGGIGGVPATGVSAVVLNLTVTNPSAAGYLTVYPDGQQRPLASNLNFTRGQTLANRVVVQLGSSGKVDLFNATGSVDVIADVGGWYTDGTGGKVGGVFIGLKPGRVFDTRSGNGGYLGPLRPATTALAFIAHGGAFVPWYNSSTPPKAVVANLTAVNPTSAGYLSTYPDGASMPGTSDLNFSAGQVVPNLVITQLGADGKLTIYNAIGNVDVLIDVVGYYI